MTSCIRAIDFCPVTVFAIIFGASGSALLAAFYAQFALGLEPCVLCLYQRIPFLAAMILSVCGLWLYRNAQITKILLTLCALAFLINAGIATYHSGVEKHWWESQVEGCAVPDFSKDPTLLEKMLTTPAARCSDIAWADPLFGFTMANYNIVYNLGLFAGCLLALALTLRQKPSAEP
jgi:disulfide bond formation protein DsbB